MTDPDRDDLIQHVLRVQRTIRTCEGCGQCCTEAFNSVAILPVEARRVAVHVATWSADRQKAYRARIESAIEQFSLRVGGKNRNYTCPFLESDMSCALPFDVKPVACLAFNPVSPDACEMDPRRFDAAHATAAARNQEAGFPERRVPIPVAVLAALDRKIPQRGAGSATTEPGTAPRKSLPAKPIALPRLLSKWGVCSRKEAEDRINNGRVAVDGNVVRDVLFEVRPQRAKITVDGKPVSEGNGSRTHSWLAMNKPRGVVTTTKDPKGRQTIMDILGDGARPGVMPVGRLDADSAGLLLLTSDHATADKLLDPLTHVLKTYRVKVAGHLSPDTCRRLLSETIEVEGLKLGPFDDLEIVSEGPKSTWVLASLREGKNRQVRRRFAHEGHEVEVLVRTRFGPVSLGDLKPGEVRPLTSEEVSRILGTSGLRHPQ